jgi:hypothetical protein
MEMTTSGEDAPENIMVATSACRQAKRIPEQQRGPNDASEGHPIKRPPYKIFGGILAASPRASVRHLHPLVFAIEN